MTRFISSRRAALAAALFCSLPAYGWEIKSFGGHEHVPLEEVAAFYGLAEAPSTNANSKRLCGPGRELLVTRSCREVVVNGVRHWLAFPVAEVGGRFFVSRLDLGKTIEPAFRPEYIRGFPQVTTVVLDPGHGGKDNGARSPYENEKNFSLDVARRIRDQLKKSGLRVLMTRNSNTFIELPERAAIANHLKNVLFVSLHFNATDSNPAANGFEIFCVTPRGAPSTAYEQTRLRDMIEENGNEHDIHSFALANTISHAILGKMDMTDRGVKRARFAVLRLAGVPAVLIEGAFLTNAADARKVASKSWRDHYASAIACGIMEYKKLAELALPPHEASAPSSPATQKPPAVPDISLREIPE